MPRGRKRLCANDFNSAYGTGVAANQPPSDNPDDSSKYRSKHRRTSKVDGDSGEFNKNKCLLWFAKYVTSKDDVIGPDGIEQFCKDIQVHHEDILMLILAYKLDAKRMGFFTKNEWCLGMADLQCDNLNKFLAKKDDLRSLLDDKNVFKSVYRYAFDFARDIDKKAMDVMTAAQMLNILLVSRWCLLDDFIRFLQKSSYKVINKDQWYNLLEFSRVILPDLSNYDVDGAWPVILDEFVESLKRDQLVA